jgi:hypothetical protein
MIRIIIILFLLTSISAFGQKNFIIDKALNFDKSKLSQFNASIDSLFDQIKRETFTNNCVKTNFDKEIFIGLKSYDTLRTTLVNLYQIENKQYKLTFTFSDPKSNELICMYSLIMNEENQSFIFETTLNHYTANWKHTKIGQINYFHSKQIDKKIATDFNAKNKAIAKKFALSPENMSFYVTANYQEVNKLLGYDYEKSTNSTIRDGFGVLENKIFAIQGCEDFSHDIFHYYSSKIHKKRNWITEEGLAYLWGNAYYLDNNNEIITFNRLLQELKKYLVQNSNENAYSLFRDDKKIFNEIATEISVRSTISALILKNIETKFGIDGIKNLIEIDKGIESYLKKTDELIGLNEQTFNEQVKTMLK